MNSFVVLNSSINFGKLSGSGFCGSMTLKMVMSIPASFHDSSSLLNTILQLDHGQASSWV
jgi:hypothetical protein